VRGIFHNWHSVDWPDFHVSLHSISVYRQFMVTL
jgi:hypothetical protein